MASLHGAYVAIVIGSMLVAAVTVLLLVTSRSRERLRRVAGPAARPARTQVGPRHAPAP